MNFPVTRACIYDFIHEVISLQLFIREGPGVRVSHEIRGTQRKSHELQIVGGMESSWGERGAGGWFGGGDIGLDLGVGLTCLGFARRGNGNARLTS